MSSRCKDCTLAWSKKWAKENRQKHERKYTLRYAYNMTVEEYEAILQSQGGVCAICSAPPQDNKKRRLVVDHDHATGRNRGLLCIKCNNTLERMESIPDWHEKALNYLVKYELAKREKEFK